MTMLTAQVIKEEIINEDLERVFQEFEIPKGMLKRLERLCVFDRFDFIIDDSSSMQNSSRDHNGKKVTRWEQVHTRMTEILRVLVCIPMLSPIRIYFLNRKDVLELQRTAAETTLEFMHRATGELDASMATKPVGSTPLFEKMKESFSSGNHVARYVFSDGQPNGGHFAVKRICEMLHDRPSPSTNPVALLSCTENHDEVAWMKEVEDAALYVSELDDYITEKKEVQAVQGIGFSFSYGLYLICEIAAAMYPEDLDALDEPRLLSKSTLSDVLGYQLSDSDYEEYRKNFGVVPQGNTVQNWSIAETLEPKMAILREYINMANAAIPTELTGYLQYPYNFIAAIFVFFYAIAILQALPIFKMFFLFIGWKIYSGRSSNPAATNS